MEAVLGDHAGARTAARVTRRLSRAFRQAREGRREALRRSLAVASSPEAARRLREGPSVAALATLCDEALGRAVDESAAADWLARSLELRRDEARLLLEAFGPDPRASLRGNGPCVEPALHAVEAFGAGVEPPRLLHAPEARTVDVALGPRPGMLVFRLLLSCSGRVAELEALTSTGTPALDASARDAVAARRYEPARQDGRPVPCRLTETVPLRARPR